MTAAEALFCKVKTQEVNRTSQHKIHRMEIHKLILLKGDANLKPCQSPRTYMHDVSNLIILINPNISNNLVFEFLTKSIQKKE